MGHSRRGRLYGSIGVSSKIRGLPAMITCGECGKIKGQGETGNSWICEDCKVEPPAKEEERKETNTP
jgi:hypothetical protein